MADSEKKELRVEAENINRLINIMTRFTRNTVLEWLPEIASIAGVTGEEFSIMFELRIAPNQNLKELAQNLMAAPPNVSVAVQSMVEQGLVERETDPGDRRKIRLRLSQEGERCYGVMEEEIIRRYQDYLLGLEEEMEKEFTRASNLMLAVMENMKVCR